MDTRLIETLQANWKKEKTGAETYRRLAAREPDEKKKAVLLKLADAEEQHAEKFAARLKDLGAPLPSPNEGLIAKARTWLLIRTGTDNAVKRLEETEDRHAAEYRLSASSAAGTEDRSLLHEVEREEKVHAKVLSSMNAPALTAQERIDSHFQKETWHSGHSGGWIGQAIYGANDGLGAVFGIVSGMAGYSASGDTTIVWMAGIAGTLASALSMGSGAYLARKSEREVYEAEIERERKEIEENPEEEKRELALFYELKGFSPDESTMMAERMMLQPEHFLKTLAQEELGLSSASFPNPVKEALSATFATAVGGIIPVLPFLVWSGMTAVIISLVISTVAHFLVGVLKTIVTGRSWWRSGLEMTYVGIVTAAIAYAVGSWLSPQGHRL
ncbi:MAG: VIT1/CCC1 transporter family protein [Acidobacteriota bacterium]